MAKISRWFQFEAKIGWSEVIAFIALAITILGYLSLKDQIRQGLPDIHVEKQTPYAGPLIYEETGETKSYMLHTLLITNQGGRPTSLIGLRPDQKLAPVFLVRDSQLMLEVNLDTEIIVIEGTLPQNPRPKLQELMEKHPPAKLEALSVINMPINSGETKVVNIGILVDSYEGKKPRGEMILLSLDLVFSDGTTYELRHGQELDEV